MRPLIQPLYAEGFASPGVGHLSLDLPNRHPADDHFLFEQRPKRLGGAFGVSAATHVVVFLLAIALAAILPAPTVDPAQSTLSQSIVWLAAPGPGGGGGGGGNKSPKPPQRVELPGKQKMTVPVQKPVNLENPTPKDEPTPEQNLVIPAKTLASADQMLPGVLDGLPATLDGSLGSGTGGGAGTGNGTGIGEGTGSGLGPGWGGGTGGGAYRPGNGVTLPRIIREVKPQYTADALRAKVQGVAWLECIVLPDGSVGEVTIIRSLDRLFGLDQEAVKAAKQWRFVPGTRNGQPVPVIITIELTFTLR
ncbi:MAG: TonB family protein [Acidobacteria bacterium]|nr:TonB family protein [Acidobacteriota bacterium]